MGEGETRRSEPFHQSTVSFFSEELADALRHLRAYLLCSLQCSQIGAHHRIQTSKSVCQNLSCTLADEGNSKAVQHARQRELPRTIDICEQFLCGFPAHPLQFNQLV